ncbi:MAG: M14 family zinc carboxypeptidase [Thermoplasmata archaeon]
MKSTHLLLFVLLVVLISSQGSPAIHLEQGPKAVSPLLEPANADPIDPTDGVTDYHSYSEMVAELNQVVADHTQIVRLISIGSTYQGRELWAIKISDNPQIEENEPEVYFNCMHHAREWLTAEVCLYILQTLTDGYGINMTITDIVNERQVWIIPMANPDGRSFDGGDDPASYANWRKNRSPNGDGTYGTDLNRNYGYMWGGAGASDETWAQTYRGTAPFSELETSAIRDFVKQHNFVFSISYHSYSQLILYPWGNTANATADDLVLSTLATEMSNRITNKAGSSFPGYTPEKASDLYMTSGSDDDWLYGEMGIYAFTIEVYPHQMDWGPALWPPYNSFHPREDKILPVCEDNIGAALFLLEVADNPNQVINHVTLSANQTSLTIPRGQSGDFVMTVLNDGKDANVYALTASQLPNWTISLDKNSAALAPDSSTRAVVSVQVLMGASPGRYNIWMNATSTIYPGVSDSLRLEIMVPYTRDVAAVRLGYFISRGTYPMGNYSFTSTIENLGETAELPFDTSMEIRKLGSLVPQIVLTEDVEAVSPEWTVIDYDGPGSSNEWHRVSTFSHNGTYSWWMGNDATGKYSNKAYQILRSPMFSLEGASRATLHFYQRLTTEVSYDFASVDVGSGGKWEVLASYSGVISTTFQKFSFDISSFVDRKDVQVRFRFSSDEGVIDTGWFIDDIVVIGEYPQESPFYGPESRQTATWLEPGLSEVLDWTHKFIEGGSFKIVAKTLLPADENPENDATSVIIEIDPSKYRVPLRQGWNLVSLPLAPVSNDISMILSSISGKYTSVRYYRSNFSADPWKENSAWKMYNDLTVANETMALWIDVPQDVNLDVEGVIAPTTKIHLFKGWNFVGYPSLSDRRLLDALAGVPTIEVQTYDPSPPYYLKEMSPGQYFRTGAGYWILVSEDTNWIVNP